mgnify:CR=1 FL=1
MADKYLQIDDVTGGVKEVAPVAIGGSGSENRIPSLDSGGRLDSSMMPVGVAPEVKTGNAFETITAKDLVYFKSDGTVAKASNTSGGHYAQGWAANGASVGQPVTVNFEATITGLSGLTPESMCFLGAAGAITQTVITGANTLYQEVGVAISATEVQFTNAGTRIKRA